MLLLGSLDPARFIAEHWQRQPLLVRGAADDLHDRVDGDDLAGLACEDEVDSRLVIHDAAAGEWRCEHGPFDETRFAALPPRGWSLLVQAVDLWLPEVAELRSRFAFLPHWRLDDVMVSVAAEGGGVGPHFDHYDVFLLQARGSRRWRLGQRCDEASPLREHPDLKLLEHFAESADHRLEAGDMLYVPPGLAHWGTAISDGCITVSVGFRAPSHGELLQGAAARLAEGLTESERFRDADGSVACDPYLIDAAAIAQARRAFDALSAESVGAALAHALGCQATEVRGPPPAGGEDEPDLGAAERRLAAAGELHVAHDPASRFAYAADGDGALLFVDGEAHRVSLATARAVCHGRLAQDGPCEERDRAVLLALVAQGSIALG